MPKHPETGEDISKPVYDAIMAERERQAEIEARLTAQWEERLRAERSATFASMLPKADPQPTATSQSHLPAVATSPDLKGCVIVAIFLIFTLSFAVFAGAMAWRVFATPNNVPAVVPVTPVTPAPVIPNLSLDALVEPIKAKLAYDPAKAFEVQKNYAGMADAIEGVSGARVSDTRILETVMQAYLTDLNDMGGTPVGAEIDIAVGQALGLDKSTDPKDLGWSYKTFDPSDRAKLVAIFRAIASAAEAVR